MSRRLRIALHIKMLHVQFKIKYTNHFKLKFSNLPNNKKSILILYTFSSEKETFILFKILIISQPNK